MSAKTPDNQLMDLIDRVATKDEVALKLLKADEEDDEPYSIHGVYDQQQKRADAAADVRAENRYQRSDRHNARDEQRVVKPDKRHADEAQAA